MRRADPTDGYVLHVARFHPGFRDLDLGSEKLTQAARTKLFRLVGIPPRSKMAPTAADDDNTR